MFSVPEPTKRLVVPAGTRYYQALANDDDFQQCVRDIVSRTGAPEKEVKEMFDEKETFQEFAKCFIPLALDSFHNYELYEFVGDQTLNKATLNYIFRVLKTRLENSDKKIVIGYIDALKAHCVSKKFYSRLALDIGFSEFVHRVCFGNEDAFSSIKDRNPETIISLYEDVMEAFIGCLEFMLDRFVGMHRGYAYVANFVYDMLSDVYIDFDPKSYWSNQRLLKETNDKINSYNEKAKVSGGSPLLFHIVFRPDKSASAIFGVSASNRAGTFNTTYLPGLQGNVSQDGESEEILSGKILDYLSRLPEYSSLIASPPNPVALGVADLIAK